MNETITDWHEFVKTQDAAILEEILADDIEFHSPFVWKPKEGKRTAIVILTTVAKVFENFRYVREIYGELDFALEFEANIGELTLRGVDLIQIGADGKISDFEVMIRPANALQTLGAEMGKRLQLNN